MRSLLSSFGLLALLLAGCGDKDKDGGNDGTDTADTAADTDTDTGVDTGDTALDSGDTGAPPLPNTGYWGPPVLAAVVAPTSGGDASVVLIDPSAGTTTTVSGLAVKSGSKLDCSAEAVFVLESHGDAAEDDRVIRVDPASGAYDAWSVGATFNPQDVALVMGQFWVVVKSRSRILTFAPDGTEGAPVSLADDADADGSPEAVGIKEVGENAYVALARVNQSTGAYEGARLLEMDPEARTVSRRVDLAGVSPSGQMSVGPESVYVHFGSTRDTSGTSQDDGSVEAISQETLASEGLVLEDASADRIQQAAWLDPRGAGVWMAYNEATAPKVGYFVFGEVGVPTSWPRDHEVAGLGELDASLWLGENGDDGAFARVRETGTGEVMQEIALGAGSRIDSFAVCVPGLSPPRPDTGDTAATP